MDTLAENAILEECARLEDFMDALYEAQPKTVRERMQKIVQERTETKLERQQKRNQQFAARSKMVLLALIVSVIGFWGYVLYFK